MIIIIIFKVPVFFAAGGMTGIFESFEVIRGSKKKKGTAHPAVKIKHVSISHQTALK